MTPHEKLMISIAVLALIIFIAYITLNAIHKETILPKENLKRGVAEQRQEARRLIRNEHKKQRDPSLQLAEIKRQRMLREDMEREAHRTPTKFWLYEKIRELFR